MFVTKRQDLSFAHSFNKYLFHSPDWIFYKIAKINYDITRSMPTVIAKVTESEWNREPTP